MKNLKGLLFWILFIIYEEIAFSCLVFECFPKTVCLIIIMSLPLAIFLSIITSCTKRRINIVLTYFFVILIAFIVGAQIVYYSMYQAIISFSSIMHGGQVTEFTDIIIDKILELWYAILIIFIPLIVLILLHIFKKFEFEKENIKINAIKLLSIILIYLLSIMIINFSSSNEIYSNKNLYYHIHMPKVTASRFGLYTTMRLDFQRFITDFEEDVEIQVQILPNDAIQEETQYNMIEIDFDKLMQEENSDTIKSMHEYFKNQMPTEKNEYTGMFEGKNLVVFVAEGFSSMAIREDITPTLYKLYSEGFQFDNFYTPIFPVSTADGEYITDTSLIPKEGVWSIYRVHGNYMPYSYANVFEKMGYSSNAYHNHTATYYERDKYIETMGYNSYLAVGNGLEERMDCSLWPNSDYEMVDVTVDDYINNDKFVAYYMTVSGHMNYTTKGNCMAYRNWDEVKDLPYSHRASAYLATQIELDKAVEELINELEKAGKLDDTVILISSDHYPYGLSLDEINELSTYERDNTFEKYHMPLLIWSSSMEEPIKVDKIGSSLDVLPTMLNLFGVEFDSRLLIGTDILSDSEGLVIFSDRSFITDKGRYNALTGKFIPNEGVEVDDDYVQKINAIIYQKYKMSTMILDNDYYRVLSNSITF